MTPNSSVCKLEPVFILAKQVFQRLGMAGVVTTCLLVALNLPVWAQDFQVKSTWLSGEKTTNRQIPHYGEKGVPTAEAQPGARKNMVSWEDSQGNLWIFGGYGLNGEGKIGYLNDLWMWDGQFWTWKSGSKEVNINGAYGAKNLASNNNVPGGRNNAVGWADESNNLWLFGGMGYGNSGKGSGQLNDLWKWDGTNWTWVSGDDVDRQTGVYGTLGVSSAANVPGSRQLATVSKGVNGEAYIFGGQGYSASGEGFLNDLWKWDGENWTWVAGISDDGEYGNYGTQMVAASSNTPGARIAPTSWVDQNGNYWLFGGYGYATSQLGTLNDLWTWDGQQWMWVKGSNSTYSDGSFGQQNVAESSNTPRALSGAVVWREENGNVLLFGGSWGHLDDQYSGDLWRWDGVNWTWVKGSGKQNQISLFGEQGIPSSSNLPGSRFYPAVWHDPDGYVHIYGGVGNDANLAYGDGLCDWWKWDGTDWTWESGIKEIMEKGNYGSKGIRSIENSPGPRENAASWIDSQNNFWLFGGAGLDDDYQSGSLNDLWKWDGEVWTWVSGGDLIEEKGNYGAQGVASSSNVPGGRFDAATWTDSDDNLWLFGGWGNDANNYHSLLNDLWKWDGDNWVWISGSKLSESKGNYGVLGVGDASNQPPCRFSASTWVDLQGNLWLFGGNAFTANYQIVALNDLWKWDGEVWTWMSGSDAPNGQGIYGTKDVADPANSPGARSMASSAVDQEGNLWLFGGGGFSDLWKWDGSAWAWVDGTDELYKYPIYGSLNVPDPSNRPGYRQEAFAWFDSSDRFWFFGGSGYDMQASNELWVREEGVWRWVKGNGVTSAKFGNYDKMRESSFDNYPGGRKSMAAGVAPNGALYIFGGLGQAVHVRSERNDFWRLEIGSFEAVIEFPPMVGKTYGDAPFELIAEGGIPETPFVFQSSNEEVAIVDGSTLTIVGAGEAVISASQPAANDYFSPAPVLQTLVVHKAPLIISALDKEVVYQENMQDLLEVSSEGFVNDDDVDDLEGELQYEAIPTSVGDYAGAIVPFGLSSSNYEISYFAGDLTVLPRPISVAAIDKEKFYGASDPDFSFKVTEGSLVDEDLWSGVLQREVGESIGSYGINQGTLSAGENYLLSFIGATFTIEIAPILITANANNKIYGSADPLLSFEILEGALKDGDEFSGSLHREEGEIAGEYVIDIGSLTAGSNYLVTLKASTFKIKPRPMTIIANSAGKTYGETDPDLTYRVSAGEVLESDEFTGALIRTEGENAGEYAIDQGTITLGSNYAIEFIGGLFIVKKASQTIQFDEIQDVNLSTSELSLNAIASSELPVNYVVSGPAELGDNNKLTLLDAGEVLVTASQSGNTNYLAALDVTHAFSIFADDRIDQEITFELISSVTVGHEPIELSASASSGLAIEFSIEGPGEINEGLLTITGAGEIIVTASQSGNEEYKPAIPITREMEVTAMLTISGKVTTPDGEDVAGKVQLFYKTGGLAKQTDTSDGSYLFEHVEEGEYYLRIVSLGELSKDYYPTYYFHGLHWEHALSIELTGGSLSGIDWDLIAKNHHDGHHGKGHVRGRVISSEEGDGAKIVQGRLLDGTPMPDVSVYLFGEGGTVYAEAVSDDSGDFEILNIEPGRYFLFIDVVGATADANQNTLEIDETHTLEVTASVGSAGVSLTIAEVLKASAEAFDVSFYPNPVSGELKIELPEVANTGTLTLSTYDLLGRLLHSVSTSNPLVTLDVTDYKPGVYLVMIKDVSGKNLHILKIVKE